ncbi:hypothetical protein ACEN2J_16000 [Pseudorhodobacter sp. W20_MBD10_FR17]|uniref:hypothetical protein n=1 Tax=Pseudorhodobacter sp. W20_MBD10_FR17 TaxID=3240266 RepID=UPI003F978694
MFCPAGYVTLAELWKEFFAKYRVPLSRRAIDQFGKSDFQLGETFGSPDDYCEDVFLSTLSDMRVFAAAADGRVAQLETAPDGARSRLFAKMSPFESFLAARNPTEAGVDGFWLRRIGSDHFQEWNVTTQTFSDWNAQFGGSDGQVSKRIYFHSLPFAFERGRYVVPDDAPPWICDVIDEHYLPRMIATFRGSALCIEDKAARKWRNLVLNALELPQLGDLTLQKPLSMGRPNKVAAISQAYHLHYPDGHSVTMKELSRVLEKETRMTFSVKTLRRAISMPVNATDKTPD